MNGLFKNFVEGEGVDAKLRRHELMQQRAEQGGERGVLALVKADFVVHGFEGIYHCVLFVSAGQGNLEHLELHFW